MTSWSAFKEYYTVPSPQPLSRSLSSPLGVLMLHCFCFVEVKLRSRVWMGSNRDFPRGLQQRRIRGWGDRLLLQTKQQ